MCRPPALPVSCPSISLLVARKSHLIAGLGLPKSSSWPGDVWEDTGSPFPVSVVSKAPLRSGHSGLCCIPQHLTDSSGPEWFLWSRCELSEYLFPCCLWSLKCHKCPSALM